MLNVSILRHRGLLSFSFVFLSATACQAGLFDWFKPQTKPKSERTASTAPRGQSPAYDPAGGGWQQP